MAMELRHLRYFVAVAEEGHITRAAERLGIQQPPLSQQIKALERELDVQLFHRRPRGVELTEAGRTLLENSRTVLGLVDRAREATRRVARGEQGRLTVGIAPTAPFHPVVPQSIRAFRTAFPLVSLTLEEGLSNEISERFSQDRMDVAFVRNAVISADGITVTPLLEEPMIVAMPKAHALAKGNRGISSFPLKRLADDAFIVFGPPGTGIYDETLAACRTAGFSPRIEQRAPRITSTLGLVAAGLGVSLVPACMQRLKMDGVAYRRLSGPVRPMSFLGLASRKGDPSAAVRQFIRRVKATVSATPPGTG
jgi:DNA-binding transcriptional LysR family regulator